MDKMFIKLKSLHGGLKARIEVIEQLLTYLVDHDTKTLVKMYEKDQVFPLIINYFIESHLPQTP